MLTAFGRAFKTPDLRRKILFTLGIIALYRLGAQVPTPGVSYSLIQACQKGAGEANDLLGLANLFSGEFKAIEVLKLKDIVTSLEGAIDAFEKVANIMEQIAVKES